MKFEDLPSWVDLLEIIDSLYNLNSLVHVNMVKNDGSIITSAGFLDAYTCLKNNPELEVQDDFFGNGFPFLQGWVKIISGLRPNTEAGVIIHGLKVFRDARLETLRQIHDFVIDYEIMENVYPVFPKKGEHVSKFSRYYFISSTYDELVEKIDIARIINM